MALLSVSENGLQKAAYVPFISGFDADRFPQRFKRGFKSSTMKKKKLISSWILTSRKPYRVNAGRKEEKEKEKEREEEENEEEEERESATETQRHR